MSNVDLLRQRLATIVTPGMYNVVFDLGGLEFIDSSGLAVLVDVANHVGGARLRAPRVWCGGWLMSPASVNFCRRSNEQGALAV